ncbi:MAG: hypothetical protein FD133_1720 [Erysipelotrichaceae bacterium]|nr:MAG: hypothetical protein FD179_1662 [Erysipelotrichaceae bacterium]TXT16653.1 MAG: hypothetical protein FD133_1720 [Erysipelotrichaceae bacterium]
MSKRKCLDGKCFICGQVGKLTYEHIPPKVTFNNKPVKTNSGLDLLTKNDDNPLDTCGITYVNNQKGYGKCYLCQSCNNLSGTWYVPEYQKFILTIHFLVSKPDIVKVDQVHLSLNGLQTLPIIKQVMSMFCSVVGPINDENLRKFLVNQNEKGLDKSKYRVCIYYNRGSISRVIPITAKCSTTDGVVVLAELGFVPIGFLIYLDPKPNQSFKGTDITYFANADFNEKSNITFELNLYEYHLVIPKDFRTKQEIESQSQKLVSK